MAKPFSIDAFTAKFDGGGALASLFQCELTKSQGSESGGSVEDFTFMCKSAVLPPSVIDPATVTYMGRALNIPGNRAAAQLITGVYNDEGMEIRNHIESWMEEINSQKSNIRKSGNEAISSYTGTLKVSQLSKSGGTVTKSYEFMHAWPSTIGEVALAWDTNDIEMFDITWDYSYWRSNQSGAGFS